MGKRVFLLIMAVMLILLAGCNANVGSSEESVSTEDMAKADSTPAEEVDVVSSATVKLETLPDYKGNPDSNILVVYFPTNDTIKGIALHAAKALDADIFEIEPVEPYSE